LTDKTELDKLKARYDIACDEVHTAIDKANELKIKIWKLKNQKEIEKHG
jgi:hypothetical protein